MALVVEDDPRTSEIIQRYLERGGFTVTTATTGTQAIARARSDMPDVVLLDVMIPEVDGIEVCRLLRAGSDVAIIMVTARTQEADVLEALGCGADDYVAKPFRGRELSARVRAVLRRTRRDGTQAGRMLEFGSLQVDPYRHEARRDGRAVDLTRKEFQVLYALASNPGRAFTRSELVEAAFGYEYEGLDRSVDVHVRNIRRKLGDDSGSPAQLQTLYGVGYRFVEVPGVS